MIALVMKMNRELRKQKRKERIAKKARELAAQEADAESKKQQNKHASIFDERGQPVSKSEAYKRAREQRHREEDQKEKDGQAIWTGIEQLDPILPQEIVGMDKNLMREYMKLAEQAYQDFIGTRAFYPGDRVSHLCFKFAPD